MHITALHSGQSKLSVRGVSAPPIGRPRVGAAALIERLVVDDSYLEQFEVEGH